MQRTLAMDRDPLLKYAAFVVFICPPIANCAVASSLAHQSLPTHRPIPYDGGASTTQPPALPIQNASLTAATVPRRSIAKVRCIRRLHMSANRKLRSSKLFGPSEPSYTPYHMMAESRPPNPLLCLFKTPL